MPRHPENAARLLGRRAFVRSLALALAIPTPALAEATREVRVVPFGAGVLATELDALRRLVEENYAVSVRVQASVPLPKSAYYAPRARYRAEKLLSTLRAHPPAGAFRVLGVTAVDISTTKGPYPDFGILGLADIGGPAGVVSTFRCRRGARGPSHVAERFAKTSVHELGHTFGLLHCESSGCLMEDGGGTVKTTDRETALCSRCRARLSAGGYLRES
jgi:archaemetzincin